MTRRAASRHQYGASGAMILVVIVLIGVAILLSRGLSRTDVSTRGEAVTSDNLRHVSEALVRFAEVNRRLPCPAFGTADTGEEQVGATATDCNVDALVVPWKALGLKRDEGLDGWGRKISYRVFAGATGFTTIDSINVVNCNSNATAQASSTLAAGSSCNSDHRNIFATFEQARTPMITVNDRGTVKNDLAYVLISHGETGKGAFAAEGGTRNEMPVAGGAEFTNTQTVAPYRLEGRSAPAVPVTAAAHFDDIVAYKALRELVTDSKLAARDWGVDPAGLSLTAQSFTLAAVQGAGGSTANANTGTDTLIFGAVGNRTAVLAFGNSSQNISTGGTSGEGIGTIGTGSTLSADASISSAGDEVLVIFTEVRARNFAVRLFDFGIVSGDPEQVRLQFYQTWTGNVVYVVDKVACKPDPARANFTVSPSGFEYDVVVIQPIPRVGASGPTELFLGTFRNCTAAGDLCRAPDAVVDDDCP